MDRNHLCLKAIKLASRPEDFRAVVKDFSDLLATTFKMKYLLEERIVMVKNSTPIMKEFLTNFKEDLDDDIELYKNRCDRNLLNRKFKSRDEIIQETRTHYSRISELFPYPASTTIPLKTQILRYCWFAFCQNKMDIKATAKLLQVKESSVVAQLKKLIAHAAKSIKMKRN